MVGNSRPIGLYYFYLDQEVIKVTNGGYFTSDLTTKFPYTHLIVGQKQQLMKQTIIDSSINSW